MTVKSSIDAYLFTYYTDNELSSVCPIGSSGPHAVVVYGYEHYSYGGEYHYIFNPAPRNPGHQTSLEEYRRYKWTVKRIMVYQKFKVSSWHCLLAELKNTIDFFQSIAYYLIGTWSTC